MKSLATLVLFLAACGAEPPVGDDGDDAVGPDAAVEAPPDAAATRPAPFMSMTVDGVERTTDAAFFAHGGSYPMAIVGRFVDGSGEATVSLNLDGAEGTVECMLGYTLMLYRPADAAPIDTSFEADGTDSSSCTITLTRVVPSTDGWVTGTFAATTKRGAETVTLAGGSFAAIWNEH